MAISVGLFFSVIAIFGLIRSKSKPALRRLVLLAFCIFLLITQLLFMYSIVEISAQEFIFISGILSGIILILSFQRDEHVAVSRRRR
jgi:drug/metabolite transporter (DMT)-like permease